MQRPILGPRGEAIVTLLTPAGALLDGDEIRLEIACGPDTDVVVRQTGATRLNRCTASRIEMRADLAVARGARLRLLPYELIPFPGASYAQTVCARLEQGAQAAFLEIVGVRRAAAGPADTDLSLRLEAWLGAQLVAVDAMRVRPTDALSARALGGFSHVATLVALSPALDRVAADRLDAGLREGGVLGSASELPAYGIVARAVGASAEALRRGIREAARHLDLFEGVGREW